MTIRHYITALLCCITLTLTAQNKFDASVIFGINSSQIEGDNLAGYDKLGLNGGVRVGYEVYPGVDAAIELLYSQRGAQNKRRDNSIEKIKIDLRYLEIPLLASIKDWYVEEDDYHKVRIDAGFSYGNLFGTSLTPSALHVGPESLTKHDISYILGANYMFNSRMGVSVRYTRSINRLYKDPDSERARLEGYFLTFRGEYHL